MAGILLLAEHLNGAVRDITKEAIGAAVSVKEQLGGPLVVAVIGENADAIANAVDLSGVDEIVTVKMQGDHFDPHIYEECALQLGMKYKPKLVLVGHTVNGMACASAGAARFGGGFASDVLGLSADAGAVVEPPRSELAQPTRARAMKNRAGEAGRKKNRCDRLTRLRTL